MDFQSLWYEHKRFVLSVGLGVAVLSILLSAAASIEATTMQLRRETEADAISIEEGVDSLLGKEGKSLGLASVLTEEALPKLLAEVTWDLAPEYLVPPDEPNAYGYYADVLPRALRSVKDQAQVRNVRYPSNLGFPDEIDDSLVPETLVQLHIARTIAIALAKGGATNIEAIDAHTAVFEDLPQVDFLLDGETSDSSSGRWLRRLPFRVVWRGSIESLYAFLAEFGVQGRLLLIESTSIEVDDRSGLLDCELHVAAVDVVDHGPVQPTTRSGGSGRGGTRPTRGGSSRGRRFGGRRY